MLSPKLLGERGSEDLGIQEVGVNALDGLGMPTIRIPASPRLAKSCTASAAKS